MMNKLVDLRKQLHRNPEQSGKEVETAKLIVSFLQKYNPDSLLAHIGGEGVAAEFLGKNKGKRIMVRCELDALPQIEVLDIPYASQNSGSAHKCGHDGHMTIVAGLAERFQKKQLENGSVVLFFQPAEETGEGALRVLQDKKFKAIEPDYIIALHNLPGYPLGEVILKSDIFASASEGLHFHFEGKTSHAAEPQEGISPALAISQLIQNFSSLPQFHTPLHEAAQVTVVQASVGETAFGTSPGIGDIRITIRAHKSDILKKLSTQAVSYAEKTAEMYKLQLTITHHDLFPQTKNNSEVIQIIEQSALNQKLQIKHMDNPFPWSEDFGNFTETYKGALFGLGSGVKQPALHHPDYDFPDTLIDTGINLFEEIIHLLTESAHV